MHTDEIDMHHAIEETTKSQPYVIKEHKVGELVNELTLIANKYKGCQCMRTMLSEAVTKHLKT